MYDPMTQKEWQEFCSATLHGPPPWKTLRRIYSTVDARDMEVERLHRLVWGAVHNAGRLSNRERPRWAHVTDALGVGSTTARELCQEFELDPDEELGGEEAGEL